MKMLKAAALLAVVAQLAACGDSGDPTVTAADQPSAGDKWLRAAAVATPAKAGDDRWAALERAAGPGSKRLVLPHGPPPEEVVVKDLRLGKGPTIDTWDRFALKYRSFDYKTGRPIDESSVTRIAYSYGVGELVKAWEPGLKGMRVGGMRELVAPGAWAYGEPVVYVIELLDLIKEE
jgi:peptidylprolyl isomerase